MLRIRVKSQLGDFYLLVGPTMTIGNMGIAAQQKIKEMYNQEIVYSSVQDEDGVDLPPDYSVGSFLQDYAIIYLKGKDDNTVATPSAHPPQQSQSQIQTRRPLSESGLQNHGEFPFAMSDGQNVAPIQTLTWVEKPKAKVLQNKEFSFSFSMAQGMDVPSSPNDYMNNASDGESEISDDLPFNISVTEEGNNEPLSRNFVSYRVKKYGSYKPGFYTVFMKLRKNSHYGHIRFVVSVYLQSQNCRLGNVLKSTPFVVLSKIRKRKTKRKRDLDVGSGQQDKRQRLIPQVEVPHDQYYRLPAMAHHSDVLLPPFPAERYANRQAPNGFAFSTNLAQGARSNSL
eukprot:TRINITY_DN10573_c0_g1_i1.p1 TRINITY_DN10573_c0_g1~~TRINITY_DN10573_c0_g1_i1.p1  ORF type:complete len:341 (+),score=32.17 TRINITY_DN10573_c0_g1_i1:29-1051(+)